MNSGLSKLISNLDTKAIHPKRKELLKKISLYIAIKRKKDQKVRLIFICTHNSRRSHFSQIWAQTMSHYFSIDNFFSYSGGTEGTGIYKSVIKVLEDMSFEIEKLSQGNNPVYMISFDNNEMPIIGFSKKYSHNFNPESEYAAIMTCSDADQNCPIIIGAEKRVAMPFDDPKTYDNTEVELEKYHAKSIEIATEMKYIFEQVKQMDE